MFKLSKVFVHRPVRIAKPDVQWSLWWSRLQKHGVFVVVITLKHRNATAIQITWSLYGCPLKFERGNLIQTTKHFHYVFCSVESDHLRNSHIQHWNSDEWETASAALKTKDTTSPLFPPRCSSPLPPFGRSLSFISWVFQLVLTLCLSSITLMLMLIMLILMLIMFKLLSYAFISYFSERNNKWYFSHYPCT